MNDNPSPAGVAVMVILALLFWGTLALWGVNAAYKLVTGEPLIEAPAPVSVRLPQGE